MKKTFSLVVAITLLAGTATAASPDTCPVFVLKKAGPDFAIETVELADNETQVFTASEQTGIIDVIMPVGPGLSGSMSKWGDRALLIVRHADGKLQVTSRLAGGKEWKRPARPLDELADYDVRVSVTAADGTKASFLILQHKEVVRETVGPVVDVFGGKIPMSAGDFTLCTDTYRHTMGSQVEGEARLEYDRWPLVVARLPNGTQGVFIVDIGAGATVVAREFLPKETQIEKASMVQYTAGGKKMLKYAPSGATGTVDTILGHATLPELRLGTIRFENQPVNVIKEMPDFYGRPMAGILGMDMLRRCKVLSMSLTDTADSAPTLRMARSMTSSDPKVLELPFTFASSHLVVDGRLNGSPVHFIMDTGAPDIFLDVEAARRIGVKSESEKAYAGSGLDGGSVDVTEGTAADLTLAGRSFGPVKTQLSALSCFLTLRTNGQNAGLLGNSFFGRFKRVELDFDRRVVRLVD